MQTKQTDLRDFGKRSGYKVYPVSMGGMRFPADEDQAVSLIRQAIDAGMVYIDTSRGYADSEIKIGKALKNGYREKVILSSKWCPWNLRVEPTDDTSAESTYKRICECIQRLDVEYLDFFQLWSINNAEHYRKATCKGGMLDGISKAMKEGIVKHTGFTTHDTPENVSRYIDEADWCQTILFTYNIINRQYEDVIAKAHQKGIATVVMNPIAGGLLAQKSKIFDAILAKALGDGNELVATAHRWLNSNENIDTIICGVAKPSDITSTIEHYSMPKFTAEQMKEINRAFEEISSRRTGYCVDCRYCLPCPAGINIPIFMQAAYISEVLGYDKKAQSMYNWYTGDVNADASADPGECIQCRRCEQKCTQKIKIVEKLKEIKAKFGSEN